MIGPRAIRRIFDIPGVTGGGMNPAIKFPDQL